ncbi:hypothetical protein PLANPX_5648 [Lacipirellula parvula]|uniref:Uncharacterized protein n=1 Tax=Lacipirellula parvula TaxID=2650471 RepID=A0A5K7XMI4_9BACT|nr:hypothetical protein PLANPX_5648 [Lacipirellula parvula]
MVGLDWLVLASSSRFTTAQTAEDPCGETTRVQHGGMARVTHNDADANPPGPFKIAFN